MDDQITVLIVDDEEAGRETLAGVLFSQGYRLLFAENGAQAYQLAVENTPDVVLLDVMMPQMDGFTVCQMFRQDPVLAEIPILMVTALDDRASRLKGIEAGADDFISKPFDRLELRTRLKTISRLNRFRRLLLERARLFWAVDQATEGYVMLNQQGQIRYANTSAQTWLSLAADDNPQETFFEWVNHWYQCEPEAAWSRWVSDRVIDQPLILIRPEDEFTPASWFQVDVLNFNEENSPSTLVRISPITQKLNLQHHVQIFYEHVTHKLLTPLANIRMTIDLQRYHSAQNIQADNQNFTNLIANNIDRLETEIKEILSYHRMREYAHSGQPASLNRLEPFVAQVCQELGITHWNFTLDESLKQSVLKIPQLSLDLALREILVNAKKFHPNASPCIEVKVRPGTPNDILMVVQDDGIHVAPDKLAQVWTPYFQGEKEFSGEVHGMGLGLPTVSFLVWEVGGRCKMMNRVDQPGVVIELHIPCQPPV